MSNNLQSTPSLDDIIVMPYPRCALEGYRHGYFSYELTRALIANNRGAYMTPETKEYHMCGSAVPQADGLTISQPGYVGHMFQHLDIKPGDHIKEIGSGTCRAQAIALTLTGAEGSVTGVERNKKMFDLGSRNILENFGTIPDTLELFYGDGLKHQGDRLYDKILFSAAFNPSTQDRKTLRDQLAPNGSVLFPKFLSKNNGLYHCELTLATKVDAGKPKVKSLGTCIFVPVVSEGRGPDGEITT